MEAQKISENLNPIPMEFPYDDVETCLKRDFEHYLATNDKWQTPRFAVNGALYYQEELTFEENGMEKFVMVLLGLLFEIEHNDVDPDLVYEAYYDIKDFEEHGYRSLFTADDIVKVDKDIAAVKAYINEHPEKLKKKE